MEVHEDTVSSFAYNLKEAGTWPPLAPESLGYGQAYEALLRATVHDYCQSIEDNKAYFEQASLVGRYKARRMRFEDEPSALKKSTKRARAYS
jgi:hypothetical protein